MVNSPYVKLFAASEFEQFFGFSGYLLFFLVFPKYLVFY